MLSIKILKKIAKSTAVVTMVMLVLASGALFAQAQTQSASTLANKDVGKSETAIGDLVADALRSELRTDIAFVAASELKVKEPPIPAGKVMTEDIGSLISYADDPLAVLQLKGSQVKEALEKAVSIYPQPNLGFLQISGLTFTFEPSDPVGQRVTSVKVGAANLDESRLYTVGVTNSIANGALGYWKVWNKESISRTVADKTLLNAVNNYFKANANIDYSSLDRISAE